MYSSRSDFPGLSEARLSSQVGGSLQLRVLEKLLVEVSRLPLRLLEGLAL